MYIKEKSRVSSEKKNLEAGYAQGTTYTGLQLDA